MTPPTTKDKFDKLREIRFLLSHYPHWEAWFQSYDCCWMRETEKLIIFNLLYYQDTAISAKQMRLSYNQVNSLLNKAIRKLRIDVKHNRGEYRYWESLNLWVGSKDPRLTPEIENFINAPIDSHDFSPKLLKCLKTHNFNSIAEILNYRYDDFNTFKGFDVRLRYEFDLFLIKNKCDFLLKKTYPVGKKWSKTLAIEHLQDYYSYKKVVSTDITYSFGEEPVELN